MKLLIVDDQTYVVQGLRYGIDWKSEGFQEIDTALNAIEARQILKEKSVDIMLCDIEMPFENGLSLIRWMREEKMPTRCVLLTAHPDFQYAREAITLDVTDYVVQPAPYPEVLRAVRKAISERNEALQKEERSRSAESAAYSQDMVSAMALQSWLLSRQKAPYREVLQRNADQLPGFYTQVCLAEIRLTRWQVENCWNSDTLFFAMKNMIAELFESYECMTALTELEMQDYVCVVWHRTKCPDTAVFSRQFDYLRSVCQVHFHCEIAVYLEAPVFAHELPDSLERLNKMHTENLVRQSVVQVYHETTGADKTESAKASIDMEEVSVLLRQGLATEARAKLVHYLDEQAYSGRLNAALLRSFYHGFMQALYGAAEKSGVNLKNLFDTEQAFELYCNATHSLEEMKAFLAYACDQYGSSEEEENSKRIVARAAEYIENNLEKNIRRDDVADYVHVSAGYLSRVFAKEKECSLKEYIIRQKMQMARSLLRTTALPVSIVAARVGYSNFSQFSQTYKQMFDCSPSAERKATEKEKTP
jgi:two-component system response regulator YesN